VSPVPLMATYLPRNVWVSTAYSKATLLAAAQDCARDNDAVDYFPSFEVITSPLAAARYYEDDLRNVKPVGVQHVMRLFGQHYLEDGTAQPDDAPSLVEEYIEAGRVICDEELLVRPDDSED